MLRSISQMAVFLMHRLVVTAPQRPSARSVSSTGQSGSKSRPGNQSRHSKRQRLKSQSSTTPPSKSSQNNEAVTITKNGEQSEIPRRPNDSIQQSDILQESGSNQTSNTMISPEYSFPQPQQEEYEYPPTPFLPYPASETRSCPGKQDAKMPEIVQRPPFLGLHNAQMAESLSRTEDISIMSNAQSSWQNGILDQGEAQTYVRCRYIMAP
jgi:hypothetical protein